MVAWWLLSGEVNPEPGGEDRKKEAGHLVVKNEWFEGCCDAGDVIDSEECIISVTRGSGGHGKRKVVVAAVAARLKRARPMRWEFTWIGGLLRAGGSRECVMPSVEGLRENRTEEGTCIGR